MIIILLFRLCYCFKVFFCLFVFIVLLFLEVGMDKLIGWKHPKIYYLNWDGRGR